MIFMTEKIKQKWENNHILRWLSRPKMQQRRLCHCTSYISLWQSPIHFSTRLSLGRCTQQTPHLPGPGNIRKGDTSEEWQFQDKGWCTHPGIMGQTDRRQKWRQNWQWWRGDLQIWDNENAPDSVEENE